MTKQPRIAALALATLLAVPGLSFAADKAKVNELLDVMQVEQNFEQMQQFLGKSVDDGFQQEATRRGMQGESLERARAANESVKKNLMQALDWKAVAPEITALYEKELTNEEVDATVAFYKTPEGASMLSKQPALMQATMQIGQRRAQEMMPKVQAEMQAIFEEHGPAAPPAPAAAPAQPPQG